jgi:hypothetical protein
MTSKRVVNIALYKDLDKAINDVLNEHFDLYFDREEATEALQGWWESRMAKKQS